MRSHHVKKPRPARRPAAAEQTSQQRKRNQKAREDDRRLDEELADTFPASDPPSIVRRAAGKTR